MDAVRANAFYMGQDRGFAGSVPEKTFRIYCKALLVCANGDGRLTPPERDWVLGFASVIGASESLMRELAEYPATDDIKELIAHDDSVNAHGRRALIYDALQACDADDELNEAERAAVHRMAKIMGVEPGVVSALESVQRDTRALRQRRTALLFPDGAPY